MKNSFGSSVIVTLFGESHGPMIGAVLDGFAPGIAINKERIEHQLSLRRPQAGISTARTEDDAYELVSGISNGFTTGAPICVLIGNKDVQSKAYRKIKDIARPSHADFAANEKYHGFQEQAGGGHFSGRLTAALTAVGAIAIQALNENGICIGTHIKKCGDVEDDPFTDLNTDLQLLNQKHFAVLNPAAERQMKDAIKAAGEAKDSLGGILETAVTGLPAGLGEPWFDSMEGVLAHALFSIPGIKGVEFGAGFGFAGMKGSVANDRLRTENGSTVFLSNHNGGINGGITNGAPILFRCAVKPTPSIGLPQQTVHLKTGDNTHIEIGGRHDPAFIHRARVVADSVAALALCDMLALRYGTDWPARMR